MEDRGNLEEGTRRFLGKDTSRPKREDPESKESENPKESHLPTRWVGQGTNGPRSDMRKAISCKDLSESTKASGFG